MKEVSALSSFKDLRGKHPYKEHHPNTPTATTLSKTTPTITPPMVEAPPPHRSSPWTFTDTHNSLLVGFDVQMFLPSGFKNPGVESAG